MGRPKNQHWVPRFYLRYFATAETRECSEPQVWIFSRHDGDPHFTNVKNVAARRYLYSPKGKTNSRDWRTEEKLSELESLLKQLWPPLATGFVDLHSNEPLRKAVALFVSTLRLRHPSAIEQVEDIHHELVALWDQLPKDEHGNPMISEVDHCGVVRPFDNSGYQEYKSAGQEQFSHMFVEGIRANTGWFAEALLAKRWSVVFTNEPVFVTTDTPVTIMNPSRQPFGIHTPGTVLSFPISPTRVLIMDDRFDQPEGQYYSLGTHGPAPFNLVAWRCCERFMISPRPTDAVCAEMLAWAETVST